ncbi:MAG: 3-deoxy-manno-octulosonate cytidylyltransferase [Sedimentisphaerales bacterium]|nr:3-deoxy-manno-octulosonate cytidylyltransferase [Sedimentisphaerales bacterium]
MSVIAVIPARYDSTRFPGKVLANETGKYLIQHVYEQVVKAKLVEEVLVATDDERVIAACREFGAKCVTTRRECPSGTDRVAEAVSGTPADMVINVQGDEPEVNPDHVDELVRALQEDEFADISTLATVMVRDDPAIFEPNVVKVVTNWEGHALYFSRAPIPYRRDYQDEAKPVYRRHIGMYGFQRDKLIEFTEYEPAMLEQAEKLEQLRALENGMTIVVRDVRHPATGIDTPEQYAEFVKRYKGG